MEYWQVEIDVDDDPHDLRGQLARNAAQLEQRGAIIHRSAVILHNLCYVIECAPELKAELAAQEHVYVKPVTYAQPN